MTETIQRLEQSVVRISTDFSVGSGVIFDVDGTVAYIITNHHVIEDAALVSVTVRDSEVYSATVLGVDSVRDLAVLTICCGSFQAVPFGNVSQVQPGADIVNIGYALGLPGRPTVSRGVISAVRYSSTIGGNILQTDAAVNPGSSGGPMFSLGGELLGIITMKVAHEMVEGLGFAISAEIVQRQIPTLRAGISSFGGEDVGKPTGIEDAGKPTLIFSDLDWDSVQIQNAIARKILEDGYGYETDAVFVGTVPLMQALTRGDTNVTMEIWLPNQQEAYETAAAGGTVKRVGNSLEDHWQSGFIIPTYTAEANPGLRSVEDLKNPDHMKLFVTPDSKGKARLLNCIPGWECEGINQSKIENYGLSDFVEAVNPGSDTALAAEVRSAFEQKEDVLFYYWGPTVLSNELNTQFGGYTILEEEPYTDACFETDYTCSYPVSEIIIVLRTELLESAPDAVTLFEKWDFNAGNQLAAEGYLDLSGADFPDVAVWFLRNTTEWQEWVTPEARDKILAALS